MPASALACLVIALCAQASPHAPADPLTRGLALARTGDAAGALQQWLAGLDASSSDAERAALLAQLVRLARLHPPTAAALAARRDALEGAVRRDPADADAVVRMVAIHDAMGESARTVDLYEALAAAPGDASLATLAWCARPSLWLQRRYAALRATRPDPLAHVEAVAKAHDEVRRRLGPSGLRPSFAGRETVLHEACIDFEAMLAGGERDAALRLADALLALEPTLATCARLIVHAERAGAGAVGRRMREAALPPGDAAAAQRLQTAVDGARLTLRARGAADIDLPETGAADAAARRG